MIDNSDVQPNLDNTNDQEIFECEKNQLLNDRNTYPPTSASVEKTLNTDIRPTGIPELDQVLYGGMP